MLPWIFLIAIAGILYIVYAPFHQADVPAGGQWQQELFEQAQSAHDTASSAQSLTAEEYLQLQAARERRWEEEIFAQESAAKQQEQAAQAPPPAADTAPDTDAAPPQTAATAAPPEHLPEAVEERETAQAEEMQPAPPTTAVDEAPETIAQAPVNAAADGEAASAQTPPAATQTAAPVTAQTAQAAAEAAPAVESPDVSVSRGVFEKRLVIIGRSGNAWQSILLRKDVNPVLLSQLEGLVKRLSQPHQYVEILYSDYVRNGKADPANSKLLAVRTAQWTYFTNEESGSLYFYDIDGNAPEPSMDRAPFAYTRISSDFSMNRIHPITRRMRPHLGVDLKGPYGTPIASTGVGIVTFAGWQSGYGRLVIVQHPNGYETRYAHLAEIGVSVGQQVARGQAIGKLGNSGASTGAHLHFEVRINGVPYDPMTVKLPSYKPLRRSDLPVFRQYAGLYLQTIDELKKTK